MTSCSHIASGTLANIGLKAFIQQHAFNSQLFHFYYQPNNQSLAVGLTESAYITKIRKFNPVCLDDACMRQWASASLVQILVSSQLDPKPLSGAMVTYCELQPWE